MRNAVRAGVLALGCLGLGCLGPAGCVLPNQTTPAQKLAMLPTGEPLLNCRAQCVAAWRSAAPQAEWLDREGRWRDLAWLVLSIDYQDDLTLYYLGRAARGLGYPFAAASYFQQSLEFSGTTASCYYVSLTCGGIDLPRASQFQLAAIDRESRPHRHGRRPARSERRHGLPAEPEAGPPGVHQPEPPLSASAGMPPPPNLALPNLAPPPAPSGPAPMVPPGAGEFIEPPPAR
jgi:hypothetical protein